MSWSLDWFAAEKLAKNGAQIRRAGWTDRYIIRKDGIYHLIIGSIDRVVKATDFGKDEFNARDWTDQPYNANPCEAVAAYNTSPQTYGSWTDAPIFLPPPPPGFVDP